MAMDCLFTTKPWSNGLATRRKFAKLELACGLAMGGQTVKNLRRLAYEFEFH